MRSLIIALALLACSVSAAQDREAHGTQWANTGSPLGTNLLEPFANGSSPENPFLNALKLGGGWFTVTAGGVDTSEESTLYASCVDANHFWNTSPCASTTFAAVESVVYANQHNFLYSSGNFVLMWDGNANATFAAAGNQDPVTITTGCGVSGHPNRQIWNATAPSVGIGLMETSIGTGGSPPTNIRFVYSPDSTCVAIGTREALLNGGEIFDPVFTGKINAYSLIRFMKWNETLLNPSVNWADRSLQTWAFWNEGTGGTGGVMPFTGIPYEVQIALCNELNADCWFNSPYLATPTYITNLATLVLNTLNSNLHVYAEAGNEWFNQGAVAGGIQASAEALGDAAYPCAANAQPTDPCPSPNHGTAFQKWFDYGALEIAQTAQAWTAVWTGTNASRLINVLGGDFGFTSRTQYYLDYQDTFYGGVTCSGCSGNTWSGKLATQVQAATTAPYFPETNWPGGCPRAWTADADGGIGRCQTQFLFGGNLVKSAGAVTTAHTSSTSSACSTALGGLNANHYTATVSGATNTNGLAIAITFDTPTIGPCDDLNINSLGAALLQQDQETIITTGGGAGISTTTLTVPSNNNLPQCCGPTILPGGTITGSGTSAGTFVTANGTGAGYSGTYTVNNSQTVTCNPCYVGNPLDTNPSNSVCGGGHCSGGPYMLVFTNATSGGTMASSWRALCAGGGCFDVNGGWIAAVLATMTGDINLITGAPYNLKYVSYEGGMQDAGMNGDELAGLLISMYRGNAMFNLQSAYLGGLQAAGLNGIFVHFNAITNLQGNGLSFGTLESSREAASPKQEATLDFIRRTPCWWANCRH